MNSNSIREVLNKIIFFCTDLSIQLIAEEEEAKERKKKRIPFNDEDEREIVSRMGKLFNAKPREPFNEEDERILLNLSGGEIKKAVEKPRQEQGTPSSGTDKNKKKPKKENEMTKYTDGSFRQRASGIYEYRFYNEKNKIVSVYGKTQDECFLKRTQVIKGTYGKEKKAGADDTFGAWLKRWVETYKVGKVGEAHLNTMNFQIKDKILPHLGAIPLKKVDGIALQEFFNKYSATPNTQKKLKAIVSPALEKARRLGKIKVNPCEDVELQAHDSEHYRNLEYAEQNALLSAVNEKYKGILTFLLCTGIRKTKAFELDVSAVDWDNRRINVVKKQRKGKNQTYSVPFLPELFNGIGIPEEGRIFGEISENAFTCYYKRLAKTLKLADATIHSLRHTFVSTLYNVGAPIKKIQSWAGHSTFDMTTDVYCHLMSAGESPVKEYLTKLNATFDR